MAQTIQDPSLQGNQPTGNNTSPMNNIASQVNNNNNTQQAQSNQGVTFNQTPSAGGQGQQSQDTQGRNKPQGTGFTNIGSFLNANQGNNLGQTIQSGIQQNAQNVKQNLNQAQGSFNQNVQSNLLNNDQNNQTVQNTINSASNLQAGQTIDPTQLSQFQNLSQGGYNGPQSLSNADFLQGQAQQAEQLGRETGTSGGQLNLLQQFVGSPQYNQGQRSLDQLFLAQQPGALNQARAATSGLTNQTQQANLNAQQIAQQAVAANQQFGQGALSAANSALNPINTSIQNQVQSAIDQENQQATQYGALQKLLGQTPLQYSQQVNALETPTANNQSHGIVQAAQKVNPAVQQINDVLSNLQSEGVDNNTLQQLAGPVLEKAIKNGSTQNYLNLLKSNLGQNAGSVVVSNPTDLGTSGFKAQSDDLSSSANRQAVMTAAQAAQLNALNQLAGNTSNPSIDGTGVGTNKGAAATVNLANILQSLNISPSASSSGNAQGNGPTPISQIGGTIAGIDEGIGGTLSPATGSMMGNMDNQATDAANQAAAGQWQQAGNTAINMPATVGGQLIDNINKNPLNSVPGVGNLLGSQISNPISSITGAPISVGNSIAHAISNPVQSITHAFGGGGGKIICNELHRQGYISDYVIQLDEAYGKKFRKLTPEAYLGYLIVAEPIVNLMRKSSLFTKAISMVSLPWSSYMANVMDPSIPGSKLGKAINEVSIKILPLVYKLKKSFIKAKRGYSAL